MSNEGCECDYFFIADILEEGPRIRLQPRSVQGMLEHVGNDREMAAGLLLEVARTLGQLGFVASRSEVVQAELRVADPIKILTGEQALPWQLENKDPSRSKLLHTMFCCEGHGNPYYCTAPR